MENFTIAVSLTTFAGLCTGIGSIIAFLSKSKNEERNNKILATSLGFSAGVMIYVSLIEIFMKAKDSLSAELGYKLGYFLTVIAFFCGIIFIAVIDFYMGRIEGRLIGEMTEPDNRLYKMGVFTALAVGIHNFPEGLATFVSAMEAPEVALPITIAIAIHNIPEGIAVSMPIYHATGSKAKALAFSLMSGLAEPLGAIIGWTLLTPIMSDLVYGIIFASVAGIMVYISFSELLPTAREFADNSYSLWGLIVGMAVMATSLLLFV